MAKKRPIRPKVVQRDDLTPLEIHAIQIREYYTALRKAGFDPGQCLTLCTDQNGWPDWFGLPKKINEDIGIIIDDEDDD